MRWSPLAAAPVALLFSASAPAVGHGQSTDPARGSPPGVIYEIPLDNARRDAAPSAHRRASGGRSRNGAPGAGGSTTQGTSVPASAAGGVTPSSIHSENGFGSSSTVPGVSAGGNGSQSKDRRSGAGAGAAGGSSGGGSGSAGGNASQADHASAERLIAPGTAAVTPSKSRAYLLLLLALAGAVAIGLAGRYMSRNR